MHPMFAGYEQIPCRAGDSDFTRWTKARPAAQSANLKTALDWAAIAAINRNINTRIKYKSDNIDEWQTADETQFLETGDCEDYAILKYRTLLHLGIPDSDLVLVLAEIAAMPQNEHHALLVVRFNNEWRVLDNKFDHIIKPADYVNLIPKKGFSGERGFLFGKQFTING